MRSATSVVTGPEPGLSLHFGRQQARRASVRLDPGVAGSTPGTEISSGPGHQVSKAEGRLSPPSEHGQLGLRDNHCAVRAGAHRDPFGPGPPVDLTPRLRRGFTRWPKVMACHKMRRDAGGQLVRFDSFADSQASPQERLQLVQPHRVGTIGKSLVRIGMNLKEKRIAAGGDRGASQGGNHLALAGSCHSAGSAAGKLNRVGRIEDDRGPGLLHLRNGTQVIN